MSRIRVVCAFCRSVRSRFQAAQGRISRAASFTSPTAFVCITRGTLGPAFHLLIACHPTSAFLDIALRLSLCARGPSVLVGLRMHGTR